MKVAVIIKVRNAEYYWTKEELLESKNGNSMSREEWLFLNGDKILKHTIIVDFEYLFQAKNYLENPVATFKLNVHCSNNEDFENSSIHTIELDDMTVVEFSDESHKSYVAISNELIHQFISAKQNKNGYHYWYFYLKENTGHSKLTPNFWISDTQHKKIFNEIGDFKFFRVDIDPYLKIRKLEGMFPSR